MGEVSLEEYEYLNPKGREQMAELERDEQGRKQGTIDATPTEWVRVWLCPIGCCYLVYPRGEAKCTAFGERQPLDRIRGRAVVGLAGCKKVSEIRGWGRGGEE
jgi:hypothetical protein